MSNKHVVIAAVSIALASGCGDDGTASLYSGIMGDPFDGTGWAVCFLVSADGSELTVSSECNVENIFDPGGESDDPYAFEIVAQGTGTPNDCDLGIGYDLSPVPINANGLFAVEDWTPPNAPEDLLLSFTGTIDGDSASGTASRDFSGDDCSVSWTATRD